MIGFVRYPRTRYDYDLAIKRGDLKVIKGLLDGRFTVIDNVVVEDENATIFKLGYEVAYLSEILGGYESSYAQEWQATIDAQIE